MPFALREKQRERRAIVATAQSPRGGAQRPPGVALRWSTHPRPWLSRAQRGPGRGAGRNPEL